MPSARPEPILPDSARPQPGNPAQLTPSPTEEPILSAIGNEVNPSKSQFQTLDLPWTSLQVSRSSTRSRRSSSAEFTTSAPTMTAVQGRRNGAAGLAARRRGGQAALESPAA